MNIERQMIGAGYERRHYHIDGGEDVVYVAFEEGWAKSANAYSARRGRVRLRTAQPSPTRRSRYWPYSSLRILTPRRRTSSAVR